MRNKKILTVQTLRRRKALIIFVFCAIAVLFTVYFSVFCRVNNMIIETGERISSTSIIRAVDIMPGRHLYSISEAKLEKSIKKISPYIKSVSVKRKLPTEIVIAVEEYDAAYYIEQGGLCYVLSDALYVLEARTLTELNEREESLPARLQLPETVPIALYTQIDFESKTVREEIYSLISVFAESGIVDSLTALDLTNTASITADVSGRYHLALGASHEMKEKLSFASNCVSYLEKNMGSVTGTLHVHNAEKMTFEITGVLGDS